MAPLRNTPYGRSSKIILPPEYSSPKSRLDDYCVKIRNDTNTAAWIDRQSKTIAAAFGEPWRPRTLTRRRRPKKKRNGNSNANVERKDGAMPDDTIKDQDVILEFTTLMESEELTVASQQPYSASQVDRPFVPVHNNNNHTSNNGGNKCKESEAIPPQTEASPIDLLPGTPELVECLIKERPRNRTWQINSQGHLIISESLSTQLAGLKIPPPNEESPLPLQSAAVARLAAENRQLEAFQQALRFALNDAFTHTNGVKFTAEVGLCDYALGISYPTIDIRMEEWRGDTELQCCLAYYLLRGILKRYGDLPFPDRVDIRKSGAERGRLLVPYGAGQEEMDGEGERVRRRIIDEVRIERGLAQELEARRIETEIYQWSSRLRKRTG